LKRYLCFAGFICLSLIHFAARGQCPPIQGLEVICVGSTITLSSTGGAGTWLSSNTTVATVAGVGGPVAASATVYGAATGAVGIVFSAAGCGASAITIRVNNTAPAAISGGVASCIGEFVALSNSIPGGVWASSNSTVATVAGNGDMMTNAMGTTVISYNTGCGAEVTRTVTINSKPPVNVFGSTVNALATEAYMCPGATIVLSNDGIPAGTWTSGNSAIATIDAVTGVLISNGTPGITVVTTMNSCVFASRFVNVQIGSPVITGNTIVCTGSSTQLSGGISPGTWSSGNTSLATVYPTSGVVFASGSGTGAVPITYNYAGGCSATTTVTVSTAVAPVSGPAVVCAGATIALSNAVSGGTWSSSITARATVNAATGIVTGATQGATVISYTTSCGTATTTVTVLMPPGPITADSTFFSPCIPYFRLYENVATGGTWTSSNTSVGLIAQTGALTGSSPGANVGTTVVTYSTGCGAPVNRTATFTMSSPTRLYGVITPVSDIHLCPGATIVLSNDGVPAGTWSSSHSSVPVGVNTGSLTAVAVGGAVIMASNACGGRGVGVIVEAPTPITGVTTLCSSPFAETMLSNDLLFGTWSSGNTAVATVDIGGIVRSVAGASGPVPITYTLLGGCSSTVTVTVNAPPVITGATGLCAGATIILSGGGTAGTWSSNNTFVSVNGAGVVTGQSQGVSVLTYTNSCGSATYTVAVQPFPGPITGTAGPCVGYFVMLSNNVAGGVWSSSNTAVGTIEQTGSLHTYSLGTTVISYTNGCGAATRTVTITSQSPLWITGPNVNPIGASAYLCIGATTILSNDGIPTGTWSSNNSSVAVVNQTTGVVTSTGGAGTATILATNVCNSVSRYVTLYVNNPTAIGGNLLLCGSTTQLSNGVSPGTWSSGNTTLATVNVATGMVHRVPGATTGSVPITYTYAGGCSVTATVTLAVPPSAISGAGGLCTGSTIVLSNSVTGGTWSSGNTNVATITPGGGVAGVGTGSAVVTYATVCGQVTTTITVGAPLPPITGNTKLCGVLTTILSNAVQPGTWSSGNTSLATIEPATGIAHVVPGGGTGTVPIAYTTAGGCSAQITLTVTVPMSVIAGAGTICAGGTVMLSNASPGGTWTSGTSSVATIDINTGVATGVATGTTVITYTSDCGFTTASLTVGSLPPINGPVAVCAGATINLSIASAGGTWSSGAITIATVSAGGAVTGVNSGIVPISYNAGAGCVATKTITVNPMPAPITAPSILCVGSAGVVSDAMPGGTWSSSSTAVSIAGNMVTGNSAGAAIITYMMPGGCFETITITAGPPPGAITGNTTVCGGATTILSNAVPGGSWTSGTTTIATVNSSGAVSGLAQGSAVVTYAIGSSCIATVTIAVLQQPGPIAGTLSICAGEASQLSNSIAGGVWSSGTTSVATADGSGLVHAVTPGASLIVYSIGSCTALATVTVVALPSSISGSLQVCAGAIAMLSNAVAGGAWSSAATTVATIDGAGMITGVSAGTAEISYTIGGACMVTATITVLPQADAGLLSGPGTVCEGSQIILSSSISGGAWSSSVSGVATVAAGGVVGGVAAGVSTISYTITTFCGSASALATVTVVAAPVAGTISGPGEVCAGSTITLLESEPGGIWSCTAGVATVTNTGVVAGLSAGIAVISYSVTNTCGTAVSTATITVHALPDAGIIAGPDSLCAGGITVLSASVSGGVWSSSNNTVATINNTTGMMRILSQGAAIISYTITGTGGCSSVATHTVEVMPSIFGIGVNISQVSCFGAKDGSIETFITGVKPTFEYLWSTGATGQGVTGLDTGYYTLHIAMMQTQCALDTAFTIVQPAALVVSGSMSADLCGNATGSIDVAVAGGNAPYNYKWSNNTTGNAVAGLHAGAYSVVVTDANNCREEYTAAVADSCIAIVIHDVITPNGDGYNDVWVIEGIQGYPGSTVQVFDKWGDRVLDKTGYQNDWNGSGRNGLLPDGTYYYLIKLNKANAAGGGDTFTGYVMIKR